MAIASITQQSLVASLGYLDTGDNTDTTGLTDSTGSTGLTGSTGSSDALSALENTSSQSSGSASQTSLSSFSQLSKLLSSLTTLQQQSPDQFKTLAAQIASDFHSAASSASDTMQSLSLNSMAGQFSNAGLTGSMSCVNLGAVTGCVAGYNAYQNNMSLLNSIGGTDSSTSISDILSQNLSSVLS
ncbi:MAG: hypothetical protein HQK81_13925 [Desulfovibrionaceae bacterium]|nr:hypothetical protein [Desulfovibrionaceae bacterium]MBF0515142.1 hypothetical protein [Desulfovibrionaceae bacterium]